MAPRRRITSVLDQQFQLREIARVRFGDRKRPNAPGPPLMLPRVSSQSEELVHQVAAAYGGDVQPWKPDDKGPQMWDVKVTNPKGIAIAVPPGIEAFSSAYEQWAGGINTVRCDGVGCQYRSKGRWVERACVCAARAAAAAEAGEDYERSCNLTTRMLFCIVGIETLGLARVETKSFYASQEVPATLAFLQHSSRAAWMRMEPRKRQLMEVGKDGVDKPVTRRFPVIVVDAPFMVDEVLHLERPASMASLPAPATPALGRGERPQLGPGASIDPVGPQVGDRPPPPRPVAPVDLDEGPLTGEVMPADDEDPAVAAAWAASAGEQESLLGEPPHADPVDAA